MQGYMDQVEYNYGSFMQYRPRAHTLKRTHIRGPMLRRKPEKAKEKEWQTDAIQATRCGSDKRGEVTRDVIDIMSVMIESKGSPHHDEPMY